MATLEREATPRVHVRLSDDGLSALIHVTPGSPSGIVELREALACARVVFGVDEQALERLGEALGDPTFETYGECVAQGTPAQAGQDAVFQPLFQPGIQPGHVAEDGTIDFHDRELLKPVEEDEVIAWVVPARSGTAGRRVDGTEISCDRVKEFSLSLGAKVELRADGGIRARQAGVVLFKPDQSIDVVQHYVHAGDVDLRSGDLEMEGTLVVQGNLRQGFQVACSGDVEILGGVEGGSVRAGGNVRVKLGVSGSDTAFVDAGGDMAVHHAESARLCCQQLLRVEEATGCELTAARIEIARRLRGGTASAEHSILVGEAGSPHSVSETVLVVGEPLPTPVTDAQRKLEGAKAQRSAKRRSLAPEARAFADRQKGGKLGRDQASVQKAELEHKIARLKQRDRLLETAFIRVQGTLYPGVELKMGEDTLLIGEPTHAQRFFFDRETRRIASEGAQR